jgi:hypothetical protein
MSVLVIYKYNEAFSFFCFPLAALQKGLSLDILNIPLSMWKPMILKPLVQLFKSI